MYVLEYLGITLAAVAKQGGGGFGILISMFPLLLFPGRPGRTRRTFLWACYLVFLAAV